jgi:ADP-ribose pyrophosphatase YjhB (NUDIX family)
MNSELVSFCPRCGSPLKSVEHFGRLRPTCPRCEWVYYPNPKVAVVVLVRHLNQVLLVRRVNNPFRGDWTLPGGFVDAGEDPARAAERECVEETGLTVHATRLLDVISGQEHPRGAHILIVYQGEVISGELRAGDDADGAAFFELSDLPPLAFRSTAQILRAFSSAGEDQTLMNM